MSTVGLITEYNPFHNGHLYHLDNSKKITGADTTICVMSGSYMQRGEPAIIDKYTRASMAIANGVNLLLELPTYYACSSAEFFSYGGIMTLEALGVDYVCFGSECGDIAILSYIAELLLNEPEQLSRSIKDKVSIGLSYPKARNDALVEYFNQTECEFDKTELEMVLKSPNNVLGIEYVKTIKKYHLSIQPYTIKRIGSSYNDTAIYNNTPSASAIRNYFHSTEHDHNQMKDTMPLNVYQTLQSALSNKFPVSFNDFSFMLNTKLKFIIQQDTNQLIKYLDVTHELANRIVNNFTGFQSFTELTELIKNKNLTYTRVCRCLMHILLEITDTKANEYFHTGEIPYIRILGFDKIGQAYLNNIKHICSTPIITKTADHKELLKDDVFATDLYNMVVFEKFGIQSRSEFKQSPIIMK